MITLSTTQRKMPTLGKRAVSNVPVQTARDTYTDFVHRHLVYILTDPAENGLGLPSGPKYDIPLALASKQYNSDGTLFDPKDETDSLWGDVIHVNGQPWPYMKVEPRKYRFRILDTSISRAFKLTLEDERSRKLSFHVIAADTGLMSQPVQTDNLEISMA